MHRQLVKAEADRCQRAADDADLRKRRREAVNSFRPGGVLAWLLPDELDELTQSAKVWPRLRVDNGRAWQLQRLCANLTVGVASLANRALEAAELPEADEVRRVQRELRLEGVEAARGVLEAVDLSLHGAEVEVVAERRAHL